MTPRLLPALLVLLAGCTASPRAAAPPSPQGPTTAPQRPAHAASRAAPVPVLRIWTTGRLVPAAHAFDPPEWVLYGDGRVVVNGPVRDVFPEPAMPNLRLLRLRPGTVERIVAAARRAGLGARHGLGGTGVADAGTAHFRLTAGGTTTETAVAALDDGNGGDTPAQRAARRALRALRGHLDDLDAWLGEGTVVSESAYVADRVAVYASQIEAPPDDALRLAGTVVWRGPDPGAGRATSIGRCTVVSGAALARVRPDLSRASTRTRWHVPARDWSFVLRPLLPDEAGCPGVSG